jgi:hypothetical protein
MPGIEPRTAKAFATDGTLSLWRRINDQLRPIEMKWSGSRDSHPDRLLHGERCCCYTTILIESGAPGRTRTDEYEFTKLAL